MMMGELFLSSPKGTEELGLQGGTFLEEEDVHKGARDRERGRTWGEITGQREKGTEGGKRRSERGGDWLVMGILEMEV